MTNTKKASGMSDAMSKSEDRWRIEDDLRTLQRAAEVRGDPARMRKAMALHQRQAKGLQSIVGVKTNGGSPRDRLVGKKL